VHRCLALAFLVLGSAACASALAEASAEPTGCAAKQLEITEVRQVHKAPSSWTAICVTPDSPPREWFCARAGLDTEVVCTDVPG
jgi:hypothetical protein